MKTARAIVLATIAALAQAHTATALPTMVRLAYGDCAACHVSPQGGGPLTVYGRGIDQSQSLRGGEVHTVGRRAHEGPERRRPDHAGFQAAAAAAGHVGARRHAYRRVQASPHVSERSRYRGRLSCLGHAHGRDDARAAAGARVHPPTQAATLSVNTALLHYKVNETIEIAAGKDQLPSGINIPDLAVFIKSRNRLGYYDAPTQLKMFWNSKRYHVTPFAFAPGGNEPAGEAESGAGTVAEVDVLGAGRTIAGVSVLKGVSESGSRQMLGLHLRLGFGRWGVLAEHDMTTHDRDTLSGARLPQSTNVRAGVRRDARMAGGVGDCRARPRHGTVRREAHGRRLRAVGTPRQPGDHRRRRTSPARWTHRTDFAVVGRAGRLQDHPVNGR